MGGQHPVGILALCLVAMTASRVAAETKVVAAVANFNEDMLPVYAARDRGYFKAAGLGCSYAIIASRQGATEA